MGDEKQGAVRFLTDFSAGSRIAGYCLEEQIGHGGTAVVFRAQDERLPRQVALKILSPALAADDEFRHRFVRESRSAAAVVDHPVTLTLWFSIAREMAARGDHAGAAKEFRDMLPYLSRRLGPDHPHTLAAAENVGRTR